MTASSDPFPRIAPVGVDGMVVAFADTLTEAANARALALRARIEAADWPGVIETSSTLASAFVRFDPAALPHDDLAGRLAELAGRDDASEGARTRLWTIPTAFGGEAGPQLAEAAEAAGCSEADAVEAISAAPLTALAIGYAPGQPYLGLLPEAWNIPRLPDLTPNVPAGAVILAVRQIVLFTAPSPTGWRHVGQTRFRTFRPDDAEMPFALSPGDRVRFDPVPPDRLAALEDAADGGATWEWTE